MACYKCLAPPPLTIELWLQWLRDELMLTGIDEALKDIRALFEKAVKDYMGGLNLLP